MKHSRIIRSLEGLEVRVVYNDDSQTVGKLIDYDGQFIQLLESDGDIPAINLDWVAFIRPLKLKASEGEEK